MSPFDIKINTKFRIPVNLSFFLVDQTIPKVKVADATAQTDKFMALHRPTQEAEDKTGKRLGKVEPAEKPFLPKKTGRDQGCQVDVTRLINFDTEVKPIISVIVTKTLEQALWEVENEMELEAIQRTQEQHFENGEFRKAQKEEDFIEKEVDAVNEKYSRISHALENNQAKKQTEVPFEGGVGAIKVELPKLTAAQQCLADYRRSKQKEQTLVDEAKLREWLFGKTEEILRADEDSDRSIDLVLKKLRGQVDKKLQLTLSKRAELFKLRGT